MKALILAAGYATRLYPLTKDYPKALLEIKQRPIINYIIDKLEAINDVDEIFVVTNSRFISYFKKWTENLQTKKCICLVDDLTSDNRNRRGAIGDMNFVLQKRRIKDDLVVIGGDNLFDHNLKEFLAFAKTYRPNPVIGVYNLSDIHQATKYGVVRLNLKRQIVDFKEKPKRPKSNLIAMCLYYFPKEKLPLIKEYLDAKMDKHDATGFYIDWLRKRIPVYGFVFKGRWFDIGDHRYYNAAKEEFERSRHK